MTATVNASSTDNQGGAFAATPPVTEDEVASDLAVDVEAITAALHAEAVERTGLSDFGPRDYLEGLKRAAAILGRRDITDSGRRYLQDDLVSVLVTRLVREAEWKKHPSHADRKISRPLVICGIPRTGTTALHKLLSVDPQFQGLDHWLCAWPKPRPPRDRWDEEQGFRDSERALSGLAEILPEMKAVHEVASDEVDECLEVLRLDFVSNHYASVTGDPQYDAWLRVQDEQPVYERLADTLRLIGLQDDRTWLLKNPGHLAQLPALLRVLPDARVVITHRDPVKTMGSLGSVLGSVRSMIFSEPDLQAIGPRELDYWSQANMSADAARRDLPAEQFFDVDHRHFHADPLGTVRSIYRQFGLQLSPATEEAMQRWIATNPADKHGAHRYALEDYGLDAEQVREKLGNG